MKKILFEDALILRASKCARFLVHILPFEFSIRAGRFIGSGLYFLTRRRHIAYRNLRAAFSSEKSRQQMKKISRGSIQNMAMSAIELLRFPDIDKQTVEKNVRFVGVEKIQPALKAHRGVIFLTGHFGNWEYLNIASSLMGYPMSVLARVQKHPRSDEFLNSLRVSKGNQVITKGMPMRGILRALKEGRIVGMLSDQDGGKNGTFVHFFGRGSSTPSGVAAFARRTGAAILPAFIFREGLTGHRVEIEDPLEGTDHQVLQRFSNLLESKIRQAPDQWLWAHRRWKSTPDRFVLILSDGKAGHLNQSLAVANALQEERKSQGMLPENFHLKIIDVHYRSPIRRHFLSALCVLFQGRLPAKTFLMKWVLDKRCYDEIMKAYADIVISSGSSLLGLNILVKNENCSKSMVVMKPSFSTDPFDAVIVGRHDHVKAGQNIFITDTAPSLMTTEILESEAIKLGDGLDMSGQGRRVGVLIGGDTAKIKFGQSIFKKAIDDLDRAARESKAMLLATSSRRTPPWADTILKEAFRDKRRCPLLVIASEANREGVVAGILGLSDVVVVSGESISMVSEAVGSGKPVIVFMPSEKQSLKPKYEDFLSRLSQEKRIARASSHNLYNLVCESIHSLNGKPSSFSNPDTDVLRAAARRIL